MIMLANLIQLGFGFAFSSTTLIVTSFAVMIGVGLTWAIPNGIWRTFLYVVPVGVGFVVVFFYRSNSPETIINLNLDWWTSIWLGWLQDFLAGLPEGVAWFNVVMGLGFIIASAVSWIFTDEGGIFANGDGLSLEKEHMQGEEPSRMPLLALGCIPAPPRMIRAVDECEPGAKRAKLQHAESP